MDLSRPFISTSQIVLNSNSLKSQCLGKTLETAAQQEPSSSTRKKKRRRRRTIVFFFIRGPIKYLLSSSLQWRTEWNRLTIVSRVSPWTPRWHPPLPARSISLALSLLIYPNILFYFMFLLIHFGSMAAPLRRNRRRSRRKKKSASKRRRRKRLAFPPF